MQGVLSDKTREGLLGSGVLYRQRGVRHIVGDGPQSIRLYGTDFRLCVACIERAAVGGIVVGEDADRGRIAVVDKDVEYRMVEEDLQFAVASFRQSARDDGAVEPVKDTCIIGFAPDGGHIHRERARLGVDIDLHRTVTVLEQFKTYLRCAYLKLCE